MSVRYPLLAASFLIAACATANDWPQWRGPNQDDVSLEKGLLQKWPDGGPKLLWTGKNLGLGFGTPSVAGGKVYGIGNRDGKDGVWSLKEADGSEVWFAPFADKGKPKMQQSNGPSSTPSVVGGKVYAVSMNGTVAALTADKGTLLWHKSYIDDFGASIPTWGFSGSALVDGQKVICSPCGPKAAIVALKADTGDVAWKTELGNIDTGGGGAGYSTPVKATINNIPMYIVLLDKSHGLVGVHADTGEVLWDYNKAALGGVAQIPTPVVRGDKVWLSTGYGGGSALLQLVPDGKKFTVKEIKVYKQELMNHHGGSVLVGDYLYLGHGQNKGFPTCVDFKDGEIKWGPIQKEAEYGGGGGSSGYTYADGRLYVRYETGTMVLIDPSPEGLKMVSNFKLPPHNVSGQHAKSWPHPVVANGKLFIRDQNVLYVYNVKSSNS